MLLTLPMMRSGLRFATKLFRDEIISFGARKHFDGCVIGGDEIPLKAAVTQRLHKDSDDVVDEEILFGDTILAVLEQHPKELNPRL